VKRSDDGGDWVFEHPVELELYGRRARISGMVLIEVDGTPGYRAEFTESAEPRHVAALLLSPAFAGVLTELHKAIEGNDEEGST
jgi:hypothetical protein